VSASARAIVGIRFGPLHGRRTVVEPGGSLRVGRTLPAALRAPYDRRMSGVHFELEWDGARGHLRDLSSANGTWLMGRRVSEGEVASGASIRAGDTLFELHAEAATARALPPDSPALAARKTTALSALRAETEPLFAVLDAARDPRVRVLLQESVEEHRSLYEGTKGHLLAEVAPYLVQLPPGAALLERLVREGWEESWGFYLTSRRPFEEVRRHLRRILMVRVEGSARPVYFRFYDPRALRLVLPTCSARQKAELLTDLRGILVEGEHGDVQRWSP